MRKIFSNIQLVTSRERKILELSTLDLIYIPLSEEEKSHLGVESMDNPCWRITVDKK